MARSGSDSAERVAFRATMNPAIRSNAPTRRSVENAQAPRASAAVTSMLRRDAVDCHVARKRRLRDRRVRDALRNPERVARFERDVVAAVDGPRLLAEQLQDEDVS